MSKSPEVSTQTLLHHFVQQVWTHDWGYFVFVGAIVVINAALSEWFRGSRRRGNW